MTTTSTSGAAHLTSRLDRIAGARVLTDEPLADHNSMGVGGSARWFIEAGDRAALVETLDALKTAGARWMMLGGGANTIFGDEGFDGAIVKLTGEFRSIEIDEATGIMTAGAAANLSAIMNQAKRGDWAGLEFCAGIPGTLGGSLAGNAGQGGYDLCSLAEEVEALDAEGRLSTRRRGEFTFGYRRSSLCGDIILSARLRLERGSRREIEKRIEGYLAKRWEQPIGQRTSGCMFKNPPGDFAGRLIDAAGLKGLGIGGVSVSTEHANFMINHGEGTAADIRRLMEEVRGRVQTQTGVALEPEVRLIQDSAQLDQREA